jgi:hypothetical protein
VDILCLQKKLDDLSAWKKKELSQAYFLAENAKNDEEKKYLCRAWVLIMYAHCDNFLKESSKLYLMYARINQIANYRPELVWLVMKGKENITDGAKDKYQSLICYESQNKWALFDEALLVSTLNSRSFKYKSLRFLCDWILQVSFEHDEMSDFCDKLEKKRNEIAHGEEAYIDDVADCLLWHTKTMKFFDDLKDSLISHAAG